MLVEHDRSADAVYIYLSSERAVASTVRWTSWIGADLDADGRLVGIEILDASHHVDLASLAPLVELVSTKDAANLFGVRPSNFVRDWSHRPDFPTPVANVAGARLWDRGVLVAYRDRHRGRVPAS